MLNIFAVVMIEGSGGELKKNNATVNARNF